MKTKNILSLKTRYLNHSAADFNPDRKLRLADPGNDPILILGWLNPKNALEIF
jgi:hypothetical protein